MWGMSFWAVPVFFMIAGYYSFGAAEQKIQKRFIKIVKILLFGYFVFFAYNFAAQLLKGDIIEWFSKNFNWKNPILFLVFCTIRWAIPLWYLIAMAETYLFWLFIVKKNLQNKILKYTWLSFLIGTLLTITVDTLKLSWSFKINFLCRALPWFMLGNLIKERYEKHLYKISGLKLGSIAVAGWLITLSAIIFKTKLNFSYTGVLLTAPALFLLGVKYSEIRIPSFIDYLGDKVSIYIYLFHMPVSAATSFATKIIGINREGIYASFNPLVVLIFTIVFSTLFEKAVSKIKSRQPKAMPLQQD